MRRTEKSWLIVAWLGGALAALSPALRAAPAATGSEIFEQRCKSCHDPAVERAPGKVELAARPRADIIVALTSGIMAPMAQGLSAEQIQSVAAYLTPEAAARRPTAALTAAAAVDRMCAVNPPIKAGRNDWSSAGFDDESTRYQSNPGLKAADVPKLKLKWAFSMSGGGQPTRVPAAEKRQVLRPGRKNRLRALGCQRCGVAHHPTGRARLDFAERMGNLRRGFQPGGAGLRCSIRRRDLEKRGS